MLRRDSPCRQARPGSGLLFDKRPEQRLQLHLQARQQPPQFGALFPVAVSLTLKGGHLVRKDVTHFLGLAQHRFRVRQIPSQTFHLPVERRHLPGEGEDTLPGLLQERGLAGGKWSEIVAGVACATRGLA